MIRDLNFSIRSYSRSTVGRRGIVTRTTMENCGEVYQRVAFNYGTGSIKIYYVGGGMTEYIKHMLNEYAVGI